MGLRAPDFRESDDSMRKPGALGCDLPPARFYPLPQNVVLKENMG